jgi:KDO2-lipid IV(A) lauroyltransferase
MKKLKRIKYLLEAIIVKLLFIVFKFLSIDQASNIAGRIARKVGPLLKVSNTAYKNIRSVMPDLSEAEVQIIITDMWENLGRVFGEFPHIYNLSSDEFKRRVKVNGIENLESLKNLHKTGIFFSGHLANWEVPAMYASIYNLPLAVVYRVANNKIVDDIINKERIKSGITAIPKGPSGAKKIVEMIKKNMTLAMLVDQKMNEGIKIPFFAKDAMTAPAIARLALKFGCPLIPTQVIRNNGAYFTINFFPPLELKENDTEESIMTKINQLLEGWIRENPGQWFWVHRRW